MRPRWASGKWLILRGLAVTKPWDSGPMSDTVRARPPSRAKFLGEAASPQENTVGGHRRLPVNKDNK